jgi:hypothetical protein
MIRRLLQSLIDGTQEVAGTERSSEVGVSSAKCLLPNRIGLFVHNERKGYRHASPDTLQ